MATEKLLDEITVKLTREQKSLLVGLCEVKGMTASDAVRQMVDTFIAQHRREFDSMKSIFGIDE